MHRITSAAIKTAAACVTLLLLFSGRSMAGNYETEIRTGISSEVLDYEQDMTSTVLRNGASFKTPDKFSFDFTVLRNIDAKAASRTWSIEAKELSGFINFTMGNFNLHFGSGLMMGKTSYRPGGPFTKRISISRERTISVSKGGNPEYSFYGTAPEFYTELEGIRTYFIPFASIQRRFITYSSAETGSTGSSLYSLSARIREEGNYTEPVNIINYGGIAGLKRSDIFTLQVYYFESDLKTASGKEILWDADKYYSGGGVDLLRNAGFFAEYSDSNISLFIEPAMSVTEGEKHFRDYALNWGIGIRNRAVNFGMKGKNCGRGFHSEYSSGSRTPERLWEARCALYPSDFIEAGFILYSEKDLTPSYNSDYFEGSIQEEVFLAINRESTEIDLKLKRKSHYSDDMETPTDQGGVTASFLPWDRLHLKSRGTVQRENDDLSYLYGGEIKFLFPGYTGLTAGYTRIALNGDTPFYAMITPASEHSSVTRFTESAHAYSMIFRYKKMKDSFYVRGTMINTGGENEYQAESALVIVF